MHYLLRTLWHLAASKRRPPLSMWDTSIVPMRVLPMDVDIAMHINNGVYFTLFDLGRFDLMVRAGVFQKARAKKWQPVVAAETISFRKSLDLWQKYEMHTRLLGSDDRAVYFEQRLVVDGEIYARGFICTRMVSSSGPVPVEDLLALDSSDSERTREVPSWLLRWRQESALPSTRKEAPNLWE